MPVNATSDLKTVSVVITKEQDRRLRDLQAGKRTAIQRVTYAQVVREVIDAGLGTLSRAGDSILDTSSPEERVA